MHTSSQTNYLDGDHNFILGHKGVVYSNTSYTSVWPENQQLLRKCRASPTIILSPLLRRLLLTCPCHLHELPFGGHLWDPQGTALVPRFLSLQMHHLYKQNSAGSPSTHIYHHRLPGATAVKSLCILCLHGNLKKHRTPTSALVPGYYTSLHFLSDPSLINTLLPEPSCGPHG